MNTLLNQAVEEIDEAKENNQELTRRKTRSLLFHLLYAMEGFDYSVSLESIIDNFNRGFDLAIDLHGELFTITEKIITNREEIDTLFKPHLINWRYERLGVCTKLILRFATWEIYHSDTPTSIIINEAVELAKCFSEKDAYKFINGVLDEIVKHKETKK